MSIKNDKMWKKAQKVLYVAEKNCGPQCYIIFKFGPQAKSQATETANLVCG